MEGKRGPGAAAPGGMGSVVSHCLKHHLVALDQQHEEDDGDHGAQAARDDVQLLGLPPVAAGTCGVLGDFPIPGLQMRRGRRAVNGTSQGWWRWWRWPEGTSLPLAIWQLASPKPGTRTHCTPQTHPKAAETQLAVA